MPKGPHPTQLPVGAFPSPNGTTLFRVWAPYAKRVDVELLDTRDHAPLDALRSRKRIQLNAIGHGLYQAEAETEPSSDYVFRLDNKLRRADPASRWQPFGVHGPSRILDTAALDLGPKRWRRPKRETLVLYQVHVGTYAPSGDFAGVAADVPRIASLGINALQLLPVAEFPGRRNWGYDGVFPYAVQSSYGGPLGLAALIATCHHHGVAVYLDLVFNHLGPEGNYTSDFGPYSNTRFHTPWGHALNFDEAGSACVRSFFVNNAQYWSREFRVDGFRFDAIAQIFDSSPKHILREINDSLPKAPSHLNVAESELNANRVCSGASGGLGFDAQWNDDFHHALIARISGNRSAFLQDFGGPEALSKAIEHGWAMTGNWSAFRQRFYGEACEARPNQLVVFSQNHDQIAGIGGGQRAGSADSTTQEVLLALTLLSGFVPMLFQGQDFGATAPFHYFVDHGDAALVRRVVAGRRHEQATLSPSARYLSPAAESTWVKSRIDWRELSTGAGRRLQESVRQLTALRGEHPCFQANSSRAVRVEWDGDLLVSHFSQGSSRGLLVAHLPPPETGPLAKREVRVSKLRRWFRDEAEAKGGTRADQEFAVAYRTERVSESSAKFAFVGQSAVVLIPAHPFAPTA